jgi:hypothetical protein
MQEFILIAVLVLLFFRAVRKAVFTSSYQGFQRAAEDYQTRRRKPSRPEGTVTVEDTGRHASPKQEQEGEYVDFEELR